MPRGLTLPAAAPIMLAMTIFETWPPSSVVVSACFAAVTATLGLKFGLALIVGAAVMRAGEWLDGFGTDRAPRGRS